MCKKFQELTGEKVPRFTALDPGSIGFRKKSEKKGGKSIPYKCHFFYTDTIFVRIKFTPKNADFSR